MDYFDHIEDYLNHKLTDEERTSFELAMQTDETLASAVRDYPLAHTIAKSFIELEVRQQLESLSQNKSQSIGRKLFSIRRIAAIFIIALGGFLLYKIFSPDRFSPDEIYATLNEKPYSNITRAEKDSLSSLDSALYYFEEEHLEDAKILFTRLLNVDSLAMKSQYYLGHIAMAYKDYAEAKIKFGHIVSLGDSQFHDPSLYQLMIIHLMEKNKNLAKPIFKELEEKEFLAKNKVDKIKSYLKQCD